MGDDQVSMNDTDRGIVDDQRAIGQLLYAVAKFDRTSLLCPVNDRWGVSTLHGAVEQHPLGETDCVGTRLEHHSRGHYTTEGFSLSAIVGVTQGLNIIGVTLIIINATNSIQSWLFVYTIIINCHISETSHLNFI
jgi:hypothetical protein